VSADCLFCRIVRREIPATIVAEDDHCLAFNDIGPKAPTHVLVIPKAHFATLNDVKDPQVTGRLFAMVQEIARDKGFDAKGYRTVINTNEDGGQTVHHLHVHILAGRRLQWPPG
jgi:histidine triad (HIT) family protein